TSRPIRWAADPARLHAGARATRATWTPFQPGYAPPIALAMRIAPLWTRRWLLWTAALLSVAGIAFYGTWRRRAVSSERVYTIGYTHNPPYQIHGPDGRPSG